MRYSRFATRSFVLGLALAAATTLAGCTTAPAAAPADSAGTSAVTESIPAGFTSQKAQVGDVGIHYVIGGRGPTLLLIHGYPQSWYEWRHIMPALAAHYTVVAPDLRGAGDSDAPPTGYDKKTMAADLHGLLTQLKLDKDLRIVGHDIGTMVAYSYAAAHPADVTKLVLSEAPIPDPSVYTFPALTANGPGLWNFGFFTVGNGLPEQMIQGREDVWIDRFSDHLMVKKGALTADDIAVYAGNLRRPGHLAASFAWFRTLAEDVANDAEYQKTKLPMPVLAVGASAAMGTLVGDQVTQYATDVTPMVVPDSGHWIYEEHPTETTDMLLTFLNAAS
ncbi:alpha/beta fold hydrolase [Catenuloplanes japonicus]|uniref:alpha/beta fold hydrolase n=1 Tax=Catenuloplanes japonicus TaxID=33876 RepID=UPI00069029F2|nr:alpha/beta hydrolase [Catenuloplanes japonicus]